MNAVDGMVERIRDGARSPLAAGDTVLKDDSVYVPAKGTCELAMKGLASVKIKGEATVVVERLSIGGQQASIALKDGSLSCKIAKLGKKDSFTVKTQSSVMGVRGTAFVVRVGKDGATYYAVSEGKVSLYPPALFSSGVYDPTSGDAASMAELVDSFPTLEAGKEATVEEEDFAAADAAIIALSEGKADEASVIGKAEAVEVEEATIAPEAVKEIEATGAVEPLPVAELPAAVSPRESPAAIVETPVTSAPAEAAPSASSPVATPAAVSAAATPTVSKPATSASAVAAAPKAPVVGASAGPATKASGNRTAPVPESGGPVNSTGNAERSAVTPEAPVTGPGPRAPVGGAKSAAIDEFLLRFERILKLMETAVAKLDTAAIEKYSAEFDKLMKEAAKFKDGDFTKAQRARLSTLTSEYAEKVTKALTGSMIFPGVTE